MAVTAMDAPQLFIMTTDPLTPGGGRPTTADCVNSATVPNWGEPAGAQFAGSTNAPMGGPVRRPTHWEMTGHTPVVDPVDPADAVDAVDAPGQLKVVELGGAQVRVSVDRHIPTVEALGHTAAGNVSHSAGGKVAGALGTG